MRDRPRQPKLSARILNAIMRRETVTRYNVADGGYTVNGEFVPVNYGEKIIVVNGEEAEK